MKINVKDILIKLIYYFTILIVLLKMYGTYSAIVFYNKSGNIISLIIIGLCMLYFMFNIKNLKIRYNAFGFVLIILVMFEFSIILLRNTLEFPYYIIDTLLWPFIFLVFMNYTSKNKVPKSIINSIFYIYLIIIILSVLLVIKHHTYGNYGEYIFKAYYALTFLPLLLKVEKKEFKKKISLIFGIIIIALSAKRAGMIALILGIFAYYITDAHIQDKSKEKISRYIKIFGIVVLAFFAINYLIDNSNVEIIQRFKTLGEDGGSGRDNIWSYVYEHFKHSGLNYKVFGHGFQSVYYSLKPFGFNRLAHNSYIEYLYDFGIIGLTILLSFVLKILLFTFDIFRKKDKNSPSLLFSVVLALVLSIFSYFFEQSLIILPIAILWGICIGERYQDERCEKKYEISK